PVTSSPSSRPSRHHTATRSPAPVPSEPQLARRHFPTNPSRAHAGAWPESAIVAVGRVRTFSSNISLISSPNLSSEAPGVRLIHRRDLREVQLARTSSRRRTRETTRAIFLASDPPPKCRNSLISEIVWQVEDFGYGKNTGETLPNFRQKSEGN
ncbi:hypothetical protein Prudu_009879, partial [Prunus dulcis]